MKCPVCDKGEIVAPPVWAIKNQDTEEEEDYIVGYAPICCECGLTFQTVWDTPEAALEAMRPKVSEGFLDFIMGLYGDREEVKQKLEKYYKE
jgi:hypothetical protein